MCSVWVWWQRHIFFPWKTNSGSNPWCNGGLVVSCMPVDVILCHHEMVRLAEKNSMPRSNAPLATTSIRKVTFQRRQRLRLPEEVRLRRYSPNRTPRCCFSTSMYIGDHLSETPRMRRIFYEWCKTKRWTAIANVGLGYHKFFSRRVMQRSRACLLATLHQFLSIPSSQTLFPHFANYLQFVFGTQPVELYTDHLRYRQHSHQPVAIPFFCRVFASMVSRAHAPIFAVVCTTQEFPYKFSAICRLVLISTKENLVRNFWAGNISTRQRLTTSPTFHVKYRSQYSRHTSQTSHSTDFSRVFCSPPFRAESL